MKQFVQGDILFERLVDGTKPDYKCKNEDVTGIVATGEKIVDTLNKNRDN